MLNIVFLIIYIFFSSFFRNGDLFIVLTIHFLIHIVNHFVKKKPATPVLIFYFGIILINYANIQLISQFYSGGIRSYLVVEHINLAAQIWCISSTLMQMGYQYAINKSLPAISIEVKRNNNLNKIFWVIIFTVLFGFGILSIVGSSLLKVFSLLNSFGIMFFARIWAEKNNKTYRTYSLILVVLQTYIALTTSFLRLYLILPTMCLGLGYFIGKGDIKYLLTYRILPFLGVLLIFANFFKTLQGSRTNFLAVFETAGNNWINDDDDDTNDDEEFNENSGALFARSANLAQLTQVVRLVNKNGFYDGSVSAPLIIAVIPRAIWPSKPPIALGRWFAWAIFTRKAMADPSSNLSYLKSTNSVNMTVPGELYLDFGWLGIVIGSFLFGAFFPLLWNAAGFYDSCYNLSGAVFGGYLFILASSGFGGDLQVVISLMSLYFSFLIAKKLIKSA